MAILGGALAVILGGIGSAIGVGLAGQASSGVMSEDPGKFGSLLLLVALPGTQGIYGFLSAFLVILKLGLTGGDVASPAVLQGWQILIACLPVALQD
jgi:V/A-type H+-transporting ATPase subunit K